MEEEWAGWEWRGWIFEPIEEWSQIARGYNWRTFHPIQIEFEADRSMGAVEATFILLGIGFRIRWTYTVTEMVESITRQGADIQREHESR